MADKNARLCSMLLFAAVALALAAAAWAQAAVASPTSGGGQIPEIKSTSTEFNFAPAKLQAVAGRPVTLVLDNR